jgi:hypothetical protein
MEVWVRMKLSAIQVSGYHGDGLSIGTYNIAVVLNGRWNIA